MNNKNTPRSSGSPKPKKRPLRSKKKRKYRIRNWHDYNTALVQRGSLCLWLDQETLQHWRSQERTNKRGKPKVYSHQAIACALRLGAVYHLPLRAMEGLLASLVALAGADVPVPNYSTLCRRRKKMTVALSPPVLTEPLHLVVDGTGLKVFGDGEWKVRQHGTSKRRTWRKMHLAVDQKTGMIHAAATTANSISDGEMLPTLLDQVPQAICQVSADGGYDRCTCYEAIAKRCAKAAIPPRRGAKIWQHGNSKQERLARDENLRCIRRVGRAKWKRESGYPNKALPSAQSGRNRDVALQDDFRGGVKCQKRCGPGYGNDDPFGCPEQNDGTRNATKLCHLIYATTPSPSIKRNSPAMHEAGVRFKANWDG